MSIDGVKPEVLECFKRYPWQGNIRELKNAIETAYINATSNQISIEDIPKRIRKYNEVEISNQKDTKEWTLKNAIEEFEKSIIISEVKNTNGKLTELATRLGISKQLLNYKLEKYNLR